MHAAVSALRAATSARSASLATGWNTWNPRSVLSHVLLPSGLSLDFGFFNPRDGDHLREAMYGQGQTAAGVKVMPKLRSLLGGYTDLELEWKKHHFRLRTAEDDGNFVALVERHSPFEIAPPKLVLEAGFLWNRPGTATREGDTLVARPATGSPVVVHTTASDVKRLPLLGCLGAHRIIALDGPVGVSTGRPRTVAEIEAVLARRHAEVAGAEVAFGGGELGEAWQAMRSSLGWSILYDALHDRVMPGIIRSWGPGMHGWVLCEWDCYFAGLIAGMENCDLGAACILTMTSELVDEGFIPTCATAAGFRGWDRSQPPVGGIITREHVRRWDDLELAAAVFEGLLEWNRWWPRARDWDGLLCWGSHPYPAGTELFGCDWEGLQNERFGGALESGLDNSPMYDDVPFDQERHLLHLHDVGLNSLYVADCLALAELADLLGRTAEAAELRTRAAAYGTHLHARLWNEVDGTYQNRRADTGEFSPRLSPTCFYPALAGAPADRVGRMVREHLLNPMEFWGEWVLPSIARNDPSFEKQTYWQGRIWAPMNYLVWLGLRNYDQPEIASARQELANKSLALLLGEWRAHRFVLENYSPFNGMGSNDPRCEPLYFWGGLLGAIAIFERLQSDEHPAFPL